VRNVLANLRARIAASAAAWARRRQGSDSVPIAVNTRRLYILPTRAGVGFAALLFMMLLAGLNYANSLALFFTFLLAGFALIAMHLCHRNLAGLRIDGVRTDNAFAGERGRIVLTLHNPSDTARWAIGGTALLAGDSKRNAEPTAASLELAARATRRLELEVLLPARGRHEIARIQLATHFPFGLFRAWTWLHLPLTVLAYPIPRGGRPAPQEAASGGGVTALHRAGDEEWSHLRAFRTGDSPRQVAWSAYARGSDLLVKAYESPAATHRHFDIAHLRAMPLEARLEQLAEWIVAAAARGERYGLRLDNEPIAPAEGRAHRDRCLAALALFGTQDAAP
jgi:uncharacterized protein (DUF58 family)